MQLGRILELNGERHPYDIVSRSFAAWFSAEGLRGRIWTMVVILFSRFAVSVTLVDLFA